MIPGAAARRISPLLATSTRWPSFRKVISRSSQMEFSSSTTSRYAPYRLASPRGFRQLRGPRVRRLRSALAPPLPHPRQLDAKFRAAPLLRAHMDPPAVRLHDLMAPIAKSRARRCPRESRIETARRRCARLPPGSIPIPESRMEMRTQTGSASKTEQRRAAVRHRSKGVVEKIPENLFQAIAVDASTSLRHLIVSLDLVLLSESRLMPPEVSTSRPAGR